MIHNNSQAFVMRLAARVPKSAQVQSASVGSSVVEVVDRGVVGDHKVVVVSVEPNMVAGGVEGVVETLRLVVRTANKVESVGVKVVDDPDVVNAVQEEVGKGVVVVEVVVDVVGHDKVGKDVNDSARHQAGREGGRPALSEVN
jgi:hypothetical protein